MVNRTDTKYHESMLELSNAVIDFSGKDVIEVGGCELPYLVKKYRPKSWTSIDISDARLDLLDKDAIPEFYHFHKMSITDTSFNDNSFDYIYSIDCFEHISGLDAAFNEMYRILRPNGILISKFGPIWSSPVGHHTWIQHNDKLWHFNDNIFNDWYQLAYAKEDFIKILTDQYSEEIVKKFAIYIYDSNDINRLVDSDYLNIIKKSGFTPILILSTKKGEKPEEKLKNKIRTRYPQIKNLNTTNYLIILSKDLLPIITKIKIYMGLLGYLIKHKLKRE